MRLTSKPRLLSCFAASLLVMAALPAAADAQGRFGARGARANPEGGMTAGAVRGRGNGEGQGVVRGRGVITDGQGNAAAGSRGCARGQAGAACRAGATTVTADGTVNHRSGAAWNTETSTGSTQGGFTRNADGSYSGGRDTAVSGARGDYAASTSVSSETGLNRSVNASNEDGSVAIDAQHQQGVGGSRTVTCFDPSGAVVACPR